MFERPGRQDTDQMKNYLTQLRTELGGRLIERVYVDGTASKWWMCFAKKKFMGISGVGTL
jgi:actin related protein 2/3 complex, subunit 3